MAAGGVAEAFAAVRGLAATMPGRDRGRLARRPRRGARRRRRRRLARQLRPSTTCAAAVAVRNERAPGVTLEASGGLTLEVARTVGETGVDYIAVGELTHSARVLDIGLDLEDVLEPRAVGRSSVATRDRPAFERQRCRSGTPWISPMSSSVPARSSRSARWWSRRLARLGRFGGLGRLAGRRSVRWCRSPRARRWRPARWSRSARSCRWLRRRRRRVDDGVEVDHEDQVVVGTDAEVEVPGLAEGQGRGHGDDPLSSDLHPQQPLLEPFHQAALPAGHRQLDAVLAPQLLSRTTPLLAHTV